MMNTANQGAALGEQLDGGRVEAAYDVVVVGGGAAGLSGALALARARRSVLVLDAGAPRNAPAGGVHNFLGHEGASPGELLAAGRAEVTGYGAHVRSGTATAVQPLRQEHADGSRFVLTLAGGPPVRARRVLVTTGLVDELPDVPGLEQRWGRDVLHCPYCHGYEVRDQAIGVLATGPAAVHQALLFRQLSTDVTVFLHTGPDLTEEQFEQLAARQVAVVDGRVTGLRVEDDQLTGVVLADGRTVARQALVIASRLRSRSDVLAGLGLEPVEVVMGGHVVGTRVPAEPTGATAVPGVYVAGNISDPMAQVVTAAAAGMGAGASINADLVSEDSARALDVRRRRARGHEPFSPQAEAEVCEQVLGERRHGLTAGASA